MYVASPSLFSRFLLISKLSSFFFRTPPLCKEVANLPLCGLYCQKKPVHPPSFSSLQRNYIQKEEEDKQRREEEKRNEMERRNRMLAEAEEKARMLEEEKKNIEASVLRVFSSPLSLRYSNFRFFLLFYSLYCLLFFSNPCFSCFSNLSFFLLAASFHPHLFS